MAQPQNVAKSVEASKKVSCLLLPFVGFIDGYPPLVDSGIMGNGVVLESIQLGPQWTQFEHVSHQLHHRSPLLLRNVALLSVHFACYSKLKECVWHGLLAYEEKRNKHHLPEITLCCYTSKCFGRILHQVYYWPWIHFEEEGKRPHQANKITFLFATLKTYLQMLFCIPIIVKTELFDWCNFIHFKTRLFQWVTLPRSFNRQLVPLIWVGQGPSAETRVPKLKLRAP